MIPKTREDAAIALKVCAQAGQDRFDLTACAIACAIHEDPNRDTYQALDVLAELTKAVQKRAPTTALAFGQLLFGDFGFSGCESDYEAPQNADFIDILIHRKGLPVGPRLASCCTRRQRAFVWHGYAGPLYHAA
jgi:regulator of sirC expression with transglutaminase-like and TPR domain